MNRTLPQQKTQQNWTVSVSCAMYYRKKSDKQDSLLIQSIIWIKRDNI